MTSRHPSSLLVDLAGKQAAVEFPVVPKLVRVSSGLNAELAVATVGAEDDDHERATLVRSKTAENPKPTRQHVPFSERLVSLVNRTGTKTAPRSKLRSSSLKSRPAVAGPFFQSKPTAVKRRPVLSKRMPKCSSAKAARELHPATAPASQASAGARLYIEAIL